MTKISEPGLNLELLPFLTESIISLEIFSEYLCLLLKFRNSYSVTWLNWWRHQGHFSEPVRENLSFHAFGQYFQLFIDTALQKQENMLKSYSKLPITETRIEKLLLIRFLLPFLFKQMGEK